MRFEDLTPAQVEVMNRLTGWESNGQAVGHLEEMLPGRLLEAVVQLKRLGLVRIYLGWHGAG